MPTLLTIPVNDLAVVLQYIDMRSLVNLRGTCRMALCVVTAEFERHLEALVEPFVPHPRSLLLHLREAESYVGGLVALNFVVRERYVPARELELYVGYDHYNVVTRHLLRYQEAVLEDVIDDEVFVEDDEDDDDLLAAEALSATFEHRALVSISRFETPRGTVLLHLSRDVDALAPLACGWSSLHTTFANFNQFGTGYPPLLFAYRGLVADGIDGETEKVEELIAAGYDLRLSPRAWPEYADRDCAADAFVCPTQARAYFDGAAMICRMWPLKQRGRSLPTIVWRLDFRPCGGTCMSAGAGILEPNDKWLCVGEVYFSD